MSQKDEANREISKYKNLLDKLKNEKTEPKENEENKNKKEVDLKKIEEKMKKNAIKKLNLFLNESKNMENKEKKDNKLPVQNQP